MDDWSEIAEGIRETSHGVFGGQIQFIRGADNSAQDVPGIFRRKYTSFDADSGVEVATYKPNVRITLSDLTGVPPRQMKDFVVCSGVRYLIVDRQDDGLGGSLLVLKVAA